MMLQLSESHLGDTAQFIKMYRIPRIIVIPTSVSWNFHEKWTRLFRNLPDVDYFFYDFPFERMDASELLFSNNSIAVGIDRKQARLKALLHMLSKGYKHLLLPESLFEDFLTKDFIDANAKDVRFDFYKMALQDSIFDMGKAMVGQLLSLMKKTRKPKAAYINDDFMSAAVMRCFREMGLSVPENLAILSWDGLEESDYFITPLTTCVMPHEKMINTALDWIEGKPFSLNQMVLDVEIRAGKSLPGISR
jgi:DNA-binding LacI/PurR family transcriptional regulator